MKTKKNRKVLVPTPFAILMAQRMQTYDPKPSNGFSYMLAWFFTAVVFFAIIGSCTHL